MVVSGGLSMLRRCILSGRSRHMWTTNNLRYGHDYVYRTAAPPPTKFVKYTAELVGAATWWWILWHLWHEPEHIYGEFPYPDASKWTDEELGIPPDSEGL